MQNILYFEELKQILSKIKYKHWELRSFMKDDGYLIQWIFMERDSTKPEDESLYEQHCRKWYVSKFSTETEVIRTAWLAAQQAELHECAESFLFDGSRIFDPHTNYINLANYMSNAQQDIRE